MCHHEYYPSDLYITRNPIKWMILAIKHLDDPEADYKKGLEYLINELKDYVKIFMIKNL